jgi:hypothetical protein
MNTRYDSTEWKLLESIQNSPNYQNVDILTITALMDDEQFKAHVERYKKYAEEDK